MAGESHCDHDPTCKSKCGAHLPATYPCLPPRQWLSPGLGTEPLDWDARTSFHGPPALPEPDDGIHTWGSSLTQRVCWVSNRETDHSTASQSPEICFETDIFGNHHLFCPPCHHLATKSFHRPQTYTKLDTKQSYIRNAINMSNITSHT